MSMRQAINRDGKIGWTNGDGTQWYSDWLAASTAEYGPAFRVKDGDHGMSREVMIDFDNPEHRPQPEDLARRLGIDVDGLKGE